MFGKFISWIRGVFINMLGISAVKQLHIEPAISSDMQAAISLWEAMFKNSAPWLSDTVQSLGLSSSISGELARLATVEAKFEVKGSRRADFLAAELSPVMDSLRKQMEFACAHGGIVFKPYIDERGIAVDFVKASNFIPTAFNGRGEITAAAFIEQLQKGKQYYTRIEHHVNTSEGYTVTNKAFVSYDANTLGVPCHLSNVDEWKSLEETVTISNVDGMLFSYFKMPFANNVDTYSPLGVSVYSRAVDLIKEADRQYSRILWEYEGSELAVDASTGAFQSQTNGDISMPHGKRRLFRELNLDSGTDGDLYKVFSPAIRDSALFNGLDNLLRRIEFACYLSYGTISTPQTVEKTAEEIKMSKQRNYSAVCDIQKSLEAALRGLLKAMDVYTSLYRLAPRGTYEAAFNWGDAVTVDADKEREQMRQDCRDGAAAWWEYRMKFYGETEEQAKAAVSHEADGDIFNGVG